MTNYVQLFVSLCNITLYDNPLQYQGISLGEISVKHIKSWHRCEMI